MNELEPGRPELPGRGAEALRPRHRLRHVRLLHRRDQRRGGREPLRLLRERGRQHHRQGVSGEKGGLGYFGFSYFEENQDTLKAVEIDGGDGCVAPSVETAQDGTYTPLSRPLFIYVKKDVARAARGRGLRPATSSTTRQTIAEAAQFVPLTDEQLDEGAEPTSRRRTRASRLASTDADRGRAAAAPRAPTAALRRGRRQGRPRRCARSISVATTVGIVVALLRARARVLPEIPIIDFFTGTAGRRCSSRRTSACCRSSPARCSSRARERSSRSARARRRDLPQRVRRPRTRSILKPALEILAGIPTVVFGYFALTFMTPLLRDLGIQVDIFNALSAGLVMGVMLIPTVASLSEDAMARGAARPARRRLRARLDQGAGGDADRRPGGRLRDLRVVRARDLARGRRDDDRARRGWASSRTSPSTRARRSRR